MKVARFKMAYNAYRHLILKCDLPAPEAIALLMRAAHHGAAEYSGVAVTVTRMPNQHPVITITKEGL